MIKKMTEKQLEVYTKSNGYGITSENETLDHITDKEGMVVALYWKDRACLEELDDESIFYQPVKGVIKDAVIGSVLFTLSALLVSTLIIWIFG